MKTLHRRVYTKWFSLLQQKSFISEREMTLWWKLDFTASLNLRISTLTMKEVLLFFLKLQLKLSLFFFLMSEAEFE